ncbi:hypothetical protein GCM10023264_11950 [Sphingomonas daechungensis]|uniref:Uncharacterized protein n=1 Tax=Sphingomonas daechungensis TaxID=1176646 RepID=A0ABX6SYJ3_9SPHN|nr:hypothetical protein [Sphingomonas daechungensis]QNP42376.1 hypothetical protein H9L15_08590 [Sphingomonas daechungensis]
MRDTSYIVGMIAALFLVVAGVAWLRIIQKPDRQPPSKKNIRRGNSASMVLVCAFFLSAFAAVAGIVGWFQR